MDLAQGTPVGKAFRAIRLPPPYHEHFIFASPSKSDTSNEYFIVNVPRSIPLENLQQLLGGTLRQDLQPRSTLGCSDAQLFHDISSNAQVSPGTHNLRLTLSSTSTAILKNSKKFKSLPKPADFISYSEARNIASHLSPQTVGTYVDSWMIAFDSRSAQQEDAEKNSQDEDAEKVQDDEDGGGWTVVERGGAKGTNVQGGSKVMRKGFDAAKKSRKGKGNKSEELSGFYKYEHKKATAQRLEGIRDRFKGDVERLKKGRAERKFKPY